MLAGNQTINVTKYVYKAPDETLSFSMNGENLDLRILVKQPLMARLMFLLIFGVMIAVLEFAVLSLTWKSGIKSKIRKKRYRLG